MSAYTDFYDEIMPDVPGLIPTLATQAIRDAVIEFCRLSKRYTYSPSAINVVADTHTYAITPPAGTVVYTEKSVFYNDLKINPASEQELDALYKDWRETTGSGVPKYFYWPSQNNIRLVRTPDESITGGLELTVILKPTRASTSCPDWILEDYVDAISHGAKYRLFSMQRKPWTDAGLAQFHYGEFKTRCAEAAGDAARDGTRQPLRARAYNF